jgi:hypothetical protein
MLESTMLMFVHYVSCVDIKYLSLMCFIILYILIYVVVAL